jgi:hypothetical protein
MLTSASEALPFIGIATLFVGVATLAVGALVLRSARRSIELAEACAVPEGGAGPPVLYARRAPYPRGAAGARAGRTPGLAIEAEAGAPRASKGRP